MSGTLYIGYQAGDARVMVTDSLTYCDARITPLDVVVGDSFIGEYPAAVALRAGARVVIGNAAGVGKDEAGIAGLPLADRLGAPCAAVSEQTARLGDGADVYRNGSISHSNLAATELGVRIGMPCEQAARLMLRAPRGEGGRGAEYVRAERKIVWQGPEGRVAAMASVGLATSDNTDEVICAGSHTGVVTAEYVRRYGFPVAGIICNDAGLGKDQSGIAALEPLSCIGVAAASVSQGSARIGDGQSTYADGVISHSNRLARSAGVRKGMRAREATLAMLNFYARRKGERHG